MADPNTVMQRIFQRAEEMELEQDLARLSGLSDTRVAEIRHGESVSTTEFEMICKALAVDPGAMYTGSASNPSRSPARFRAATAHDSPSSADVRLLALAAEQGRILSDLIGLLGKEVKLRQHRQIMGIQGTLGVWREGYELGESARAVLAPNGRPLWDLPRLLGELGIHVARVRLSSGDIDAASIWEADAVPVVLINSTSHVSKHPGAFRASLAHELCHLLHDAGERNLTTQVSWGAEGTGNYHDDLEKRARAFAPAFLAPRDHVTAWLASQNKRLKNNSTELLVALAEAWGLSFEGAVWHAKNCGIIDPVEADSLAGMSAKPKMSLVNFQIHEDFYPPAMVHPELPEKAAPLWQGWASVIVIKAMEEGCISVGRARELLTWS
ncbi:MAG: ImmA/IrrE family metallo-endopeptidase [Deltaproteobacteria bacterium]|nr:ImmA/IrrE family metallo-endopeptidase [Deltaproteobacteria bacterium]